MEFSLFLIYELVLVDLKNINLEKMRLSGIEPESTAWKATMLTITPQTLKKTFEFFYSCNNKYSV